MNGRAGGMVALLMLIIISSAATGIRPEFSPSPCPTPQTNVAVTDERCSKTSKRTCHDLKSLTACLKSSSSKALEDLFLLVQNDGEDPLIVNVTILDIDIDFPEIQLSKNQGKKIKILANIEGSPSIRLKAGNGNCIIPIGELHNAFYKHYATHVSPIHGAYLLFLTILIAGGAWACSKTWKNEVHATGGRYRELEMEPSAAVNDEEMAVGWNQDWGDDWEEEKEEREVKSPNGHATENVSANGHTEIDGWGNDWED